MARYIIIGVMWMLWIEYYTTTNTEGKEIERWRWRERIIHMMLWPILLGRFIYVYVQQIILHYRKKR